MRVKDWSTDETDGTGKMGQRMKRPDGRPYGRIERMKAVMVDGGQWTSDGEDRSTDETDGTDEGSYGGRRTMDFGRGRSVNG